MGGSGACLWLGGGVEVLFCFPALVTPDELNQLRKEVFLRQAEEPCHQSRIKNRHTGRDR